MIKRILKKIPVIQLINNVFKRIKNTIIYMVICSTSKVNKNKAVFESFGGKGYSCNPKAISEELHRKMPEMEIVWLFLKPEEKNENVPKYVTKVKKNTLRAFYEMYTAKFWVDNFQKSKHTPKRKDQIYIQAWHGDRAFKKILFDSGSKKNKDPNRLIEKDICNLMISGSKFGSDMLQSAFHYNGNIYKYGCPRNDKLIENEKEEIVRIKKKLNIDLETKILLFAPTFRDSSSNKIQEINDINIDETLAMLEFKKGESWVCLVRGHNNTKKLKLSYKNENKVIDVSTYEDMAELLLVADTLITDYSSSAGDFVLTKKPVILFQADREKYQERDRNFYIPIENTPFFVAENQQELSDWIIGINDNKAAKNCEKIMEFYGFNETGKSSEKVVEYIKSKI